MSTARRPSRVLYGLVVGGVWLYRALGVAVVALILFGLWRCSSNVADDIVNTPPPTTMPIEERIEQMKNEQIVDEACHEWRYGDLALTPEQAALCLDGGYGE